MPDKKLRCGYCNKDIIIKESQVGGYWHLSGWKSKHGLKFYGGVCSPCFDILHDLTEFEETNPKLYAR